MYNPEISENTFVLNESLFIRDPKHNFAPQQKNKPDLTKSHDTAY